MPPLGWSAALANGMMPHLGRSALAKDGLNRYLFFASFRRISVVLVTAPTELDPPGASVRGISFIKLEARRFGLSKGDSCLNNTILYRY